MKKAQPVQDFSDVMEHVKKAYNALIIKQKKGFEWKGPVVASSKILATCFNVDEVLKAERIEYEVEEQGAEVIDILFRVIFHLGMQQGFNVANEGKEIPVSILKSYIENLDLGIQHNDSNMINQTAKGLKTVLNLFERPI